MKIDARGIPKVPRSETDIQHFILFHSKGKIEWLVILWIFLCVFGGFSLPLSQYSLTLNVKKTETLSSSS
jgi:hypothetical protein